MGYGKTIELFWVNGTADGIITAELSNWNGKGIKLPRTEVAQCQRSDVNEPGVYFLLCQEENGEDSVYIGEAENIKDRLTQHIRDYQKGKEKYYWNTAVVFIGRDLNKALIRYLENRLVEIATECAQCRLLTKNTYKNTVIKESQIASMEEFIDNIKVLSNAMGYKILESVPVATENTEYLYCKSGDANGIGFVSAGGFTVIKGSKVSEHLVKSFKSWPRSYFDLRTKLEIDGIIVNGVFTKNYEFSAPSAASSIILGRSSNGKKDWKTQSGKKLSEI